MALMHVGTISSLFRRLLCSLLASSQYGLPARGCAPTGRGLMLLLVVATPR